MEVERKSEREQNIDNGKEKLIPASDFTYASGTFNVEMTVSQANAISRLLPKGYSLHVDRGIKPKRTVKRKFTVDSRSKEIRDPEDYNTSNEVTHRDEPIQNFTYDDMVKKCHKILTCLKKNKNAWPFLQPVDPITMGIPHYLDIIKQPMDLKTVSRNLAEQKYSTLSQFYADIELIISNSFTFNKHNAEFSKITEDFKKYFEKLKSQPMAVSQLPVANLLKKNSVSSFKGSKGHKIPQAVQKSKSDSKHSLTIAEKKDLAMRIKRLPQQNIIEIAELVSNGPVPQNFGFNLDTISMVSLRKIQDYLNCKEQKIKGLERKEPRIQEEQESSFQSDSDS